MRILLSFERFTEFAGTETYMLTVAGELDQLGHEVAIYSPDRGAMAEFARERGTPVLGEAQLPRACDLVLACDAATCHELAIRFPDAVVVFVVHSADYILQAPPQLKDRCQAVVVLNDRVGRAVQARAWHAPLLRLRQPIDLSRFYDLGPTAPSARTALVTSNYVAGPRAKMIEQACRANGLKVRWIGATSTPSRTPEFEIAGAELVIGLGRSVLEAMAGGRAAYVYGVVGGDGWVTPERYPEMEADGFGGTAFSDVVIDERVLAADIGMWREGMGEVNRDLTYAHHSAREHAIALVDHARSLGHVPRAEPSLSDELAHLVRLEWNSQNRAVGSQSEAARLRSSVVALESEAELLRTEVAQLEAELARAAEGWARTSAQLAALRATRRYRLASRLAAPLDRLRDAVGVRR